MRQPLSKFIPTEYGGGVIPERLAVDVFISNAQLNALAGTPIELVPTPGTNRAIVVDAVYMFLDVTTQKDDSAADGNLNLKYTGAADASAGFNIEADGFTDAAADAARYYGYPNDYTADAAVVVTPVVDVAVQLDNDGAELTGGDADLHVRVWYHVIDIAAFT